MKMRLIFGAGALALVGAAHAQLVIGSSFNASENFDGIVAGTSISATVGTQSALAGTTFDGVKNSGSGAGATSVTLSDGGGNSGGLYGFGNPGGTDFALGSIASGSNVMSFGVQIVNNTGVALNSLTIRFTQENWRGSSSEVNTTAASWARSSLTTATAANYLTSTDGFTAATALDLVGPAPVTNNGALNGNDGTNQTSRLLTLDLSSAPMAVGETLFLRFIDTNNPGNDAGLAIDTFAVSATPVPEPMTMGLLALGAAGIAARRRRKSK